MKEILPGIFQITLTLSGFNPSSVNIYLIRSAGGCTLVDTGWDTPVAVQSLKDQLAEIGVAFSDIKQVLITHCHIDHFGLISKFKKTYNTRIYFHRNELELMQIRFSGGDNYLPQTDQFLQVHGVPESELPPPEVPIPISENLISPRPDVLLCGGEEITAGEYKLKVINTPGHTPGHVAYFEPEKGFIMSGDMILPTIATNAALHVQHTDDPLQKYLSSLHTLRELDIKLIMPGHEHIFTNHRERIEKLLRHHEAKAKDICRAFSDDQPKSAYNVSRILSWSPGNRATNWNNLTGWDKRFAVLQSIAHLEKLTCAGILTRFSQDGKIYYRKHNCN
jgi:glyoxylase-like metal-dependent hydrolase (beta-lactamase superfamily II)